MNKSNRVKLTSYCEYSVKQMKQRAVDFFEEMQRRRTVREFSDRPVPQEIIKDCLSAAGTAPSGANMQPWSFVVVSDPEIKRQIRQAAEQNERALYQERASEEWLEALAPLETDPHKPFLEIAPCLIVVLAQPYGLTSDGRKIKHYYVQESVGLAAGILLTAIHHAGLVCVTYTPSPMKFLSDILERPANERPFLVLAVGYPAENATIPDLKKKSLTDIVTFV